MRSPTNCNNCYSQKLPYVHMCAVLHSFTALVFGSLCKLWKLLFGFGVFRGKLYKRQHMKDVKDVKVVKDVPGIQPFCILSYKSVDSTKISCVASATTGNMKQETGNRKQEHGTRKGPCVVSTSEIHRERVLVVNGHLESEFVRCREWAPGEGVYSEHCPGDEVRELCACLSRLERGRERGRGVG